MIRILKHGHNADLKTQDATSVRDTVTQILGDIETRGDLAVAEYSSKFDQWSPPSFRLSD